MRKIRTTLAMFLVAMFIAPPLSMSVAPRPVEAQDVGGAAVSIAACLVAQLVGQFMGAIGSAVNAAIAVPVSNVITEQASTASASNSWSLIVKECVLDTLIWALKEMIIQQLMRDVVGWVESGFEGSPGFVQDTGQWFRDLSEEFLTQVLIDSGVDELCAPFRADVQFSLYLDTLTPRYNDGRGSMACDLDSFLNGSTFDIFVRNGDYNTAGAAGMFGIQMDNNNPVGSYYSVQREIGKRVNDVIIKPLDKSLAYGDGFISTMCDANGDPSDGNEETCTPGKFIQEQLSEHASAPLQELIAADEFAEILNALIAAFVSEVLNSSDGLLGSSRDTRRAGGYWDSASAGGSGTTVTEDWCVRYPAAPGCGGTVPAPVPVLPPSSELTPAQMQELNDYRTDLQVALSALSLNVSSRSRAIRDIYMPRILALQSDLSRVDTTRWVAYGELNAIREQIRLILAALGIVLIPLPAPLVAPPPPPAPLPPPGPGPIP